MSLSPNAPCPSKRPGVRISHLKTELDTILQRIERLYIEYSEDQDRLGEYRGLIFEEEKNAEFERNFKHQERYKQNLRLLGTMRVKMDRMESDLRRLLVRIDDLTETKKVLVKGIKELEKAGKA